jgi:endonuclease YncB( thermonuclease family)
VRVRALAAISLCAIVWVAPAAGAQERYAATVSEVVDGDTVDAQLTGGPMLRVRLIGIDAPEAGDCGADAARAVLSQLVLGRSVSLVSDPTQPAQDSFGRSLFYVDRDDGVDAGLEMLRSGWAEVLVVDREFQRLDGYRGAEREAEALDGGVWDRCGGDFSRSRADEERARRLSAVAFVRRYYRRVSSRRFAAAWRMLAPSVRRKLGPFAGWRAGHRRSLGASVRTARARLSRGRAVVSLRLATRDRDACSGRVVRQQFRGRWVLAPRPGGWTAVRVRMRKTGGGRVRLSKSECRPARPRRIPAPPPPPSRPPPPPPRDCQGYDPCLPPGPDVDCAGGSGNGPRYVNGPVRVSGDDPYGLDSDNDGVACES